MINGKFSDMQTENSHLLEIELQWKQREKFISFMKPQQIATGQ
jgi:hypothetical protein